MKSIRLHALFCLIALLVAGCGGGGTASTPGPAAGGVATGVFSDAPVAGIRYRFGSYSGLTDPGGTFTYSTGATGVFRIGDIIVGRTVGKAVVTPLDLAKNQHPEDTDAQARARAVKLVQFLTSIGGGPDQTTLAVPAALLKKATGTGFASVDLATADLAATLSSLGSYRLTDAASAETHLDRSLANLAHASHAGHYVSRNSTGNSIVVLRIDSQGGVQGSTTDTMVSTGVTGTVGPDGLITFAPIPIMRNLGYNFSGTAVSDGLGNITGNITVTITHANSSDTTPATEQRTYKVDVERVTGATNRFAGAFADGGETFAVAVDAVGNMVGYGVPGGPAVRNGAVGTPLHGQVDLGTGKFVMQGGGLSYIGTISDREITGNWTEGTASGTLLAYQMM